MKEVAMPKRLVVLGASAGGVEALKTIVSALPADLDAAVLLVLHIPVHTPTALHTVLDAAGPLHTKLAEDGEHIRHGKVYVAPTDRHLVVEGKHLRLTRGPRENRVRPCVDVLFRSAALHFGPGVIGAVLTGTLDDGTAGLWAIKDRAGVTIVQDPQDCEWNSMPRSALKHVSVDYVLPLAAIGETIARLVREPVPSHVAQVTARDRMKIETEIAIEGDALRRGVMNMGEISSNTCPECHGVLVKIQEGSVLRFRCHTGHAFSLQTLLVDVDDAIDDSLWNAIRAIEERALVLREMEAMALSSNERATAKECATQAKDAELRAQRVRDLVVKAESVAETSRITALGGLSESN
jgi:two-component system, chemotaxis family, protein-glutamate methylesterase/glutaminase